MWNDDAWILALRLADSHHVRHCVSGYPRNVARSSIRMGVGFRTVKHPCSPDRNDVGKSLIGCPANKSSAIGPAVGSKDSSPTVTLSSSRSSPLAISAMARKGNCGAIVMAILAPAGMACEPNVSGIIGTHRHSSVATGSWRGGSSARFFIMFAFLSAPLE